MDTCELVWLACSQWHQCKVADLAHALCRCTLSVFHPEAQRHHMRIRYSKTKHTGCQHRVKWTVCRGHCTINPSYLDYVDSDAPEIRLSAPQIVCQKLLQALYFSLCLGH